MKTRYINTGLGEIAVPSSHLNIEENCLPVELNPEIIPFAPWSAEAIASAKIKQADCLEQKEFNAEAKFYGTDKATEVKGRKVILNTVIGIIALGWITGYW